MHYHKTRFITYNERIWNILSIFAFEQLFFPQFSCQELPIIFGSRYFYCSLHDYIYRTGVIIKYHGIGRIHIFYLFVFYIYWNRIYNVENKIRIISEIIILEQTNNKERIIFIPIKEEKFSTSTKIIKRNYFCHSFYINFAFPLILCRIYISYSFYQSPRNWKEKKRLEQDNDIMSVIVIILYVADNDHVCVNL